MATPTHSVIVPVLNGARYVRPCLDSILPELGEDDEVIVVDNGSTDGTPALVEAYADRRIVLLHESERGTANARNTGIVNARGRYFSFQDHDDLWPRGRQRALLDALMSTPNANAAHGRMLVIFDGVDADPIYAAMEGQYVLAHSIVTALFDRNLIEKTGLLDATMGLTADVDYLVRLRQAGMAAATCDADVHIRRRHTHNSSHADQTSIRADVMQIMRRNIMRKRYGQ